MIISDATNIRPGTDVPAAIVPAVPYAPTVVPYAATSTTSLTITNVNPRTFIVTSYLSYKVGSRVRATSVGSGVWMEGIVTDYSGVELTIEMDRSIGTGTHADWALNIAGENGTQVVPASGLVFNATLVESHLTNNATFALKTLSGDDPTVSNPVIVVTPLGEVRQINTALSLTLPAGASLGANTANTPFRVWFTLVDDGGYIRLAAVQCRVVATNQIAALPSNGIVLSVTAPPGGTAGVFYSNFSIVSDRPFAIFAVAEYDAGFANAGNWAISPSRIILHSFGIAVPGETISDTYNRSGAFSSGTAGFPIDDTIPQISEGAQILSQAFTPRSLFSVLEIHSQAILHPGGGFQLEMGVFRQGVNNALGAFWSYPSIEIQQRVVVTDFPASVAAQTYSMRAGGQSSNTWYLNGAAGGRVFGGNMDSYLLIRERIT
jgi:hypothetical protein